MGGSKKEEKTLRLYNLDTDIGETTDVSDKNPEIVAKLSALIAKMDSEIGGQNPKARRPAGIAENPVTLYPSEQKSPKGTRKKTEK
jgi:hypothetical protein